MPSVVLSPAPILAFLDNAGKPLVGGQLFSYQAGTPNLLPTYTDSTGNFENTNPIILNSRGEIAYQTGQASGLWIPPNVAYKFVLSDSLGNQIWSIDNVIDIQVVLSRALIGGYLYPPSDEEIAAGFVPVDLGYIWGDIRRAGAAVDGVTDDWAAVQATLNISQFSQGRVASTFIPAGQGALVSQPLRIYKNTRLHGDGMNNSFIVYTGTGDAIQSVWPVNSSTQAFITIEDLGITTTAGTGSLGAGFSDLGGSYIQLNRVYIYNFKYGVIFDQTENSSVGNSVFTSIYDTTAAGVWLVNGSDHTPGANPGFTNRITIDRCQFSFTVGSTTTTIGVQDDGGTNHAITNNNFNGCKIGARYSYVSALTHENNEHENAFVVDCLLDETTLAGAYFGPVYGFTIANNIFTSPGASGGSPLGGVIVNSAINGNIVDNVFANYSNGGVYFPNTGSFAFNVSSGIVIEGNDKVVTGPSRTLAPLVAAANGAVLKACQLNQVPVTYVETALTVTGSQAVQPKSMDGIRVGCRLVCRNNDGTNAEQVLVTAVSGVTFTASFTSTKIANWTVRGGTPTTQIDGSGAFVSSTTASVVFAVPQYDTNYRINLTPTADPVGRWWVSTKSTTGFTVSSSASNSASFDWQLISD